MDPKLQQALIALITALTVGGADYIARMGEVKRADSNREANYQARDELRTCLRALGEAMED